MLKFDQNRGRHRRGCHAARTDRHSRPSSFVTGIPGAGKTLCGLNTVFATETGAAFLTGNFPLVYVIARGAGARRQRPGAEYKMARQETESAIQPLMGFLRDNLERQAAPTSKSSFSTKRNAPGMPRSAHANSAIRKVRRRCSWTSCGATRTGQRSSRWSVTGRRYTGEAGLSGSGERRCSDVRSGMSVPRLALGARDARQRLFDKARHPDNRQSGPSSGRGRSFDQSAAAAPWVDAVLKGEVHAVPAKSPIAADGVPSY